MPFNLRNVVRLSASVIDIIFLLPTASWAAAVTSSTKAAEVVLPAFLGPLTRMEA